MSMDIQGNLTKIPLSENAILHQSGVSFFRIFTAYRKEKKIRTEKIVSGVISRRAFLDIEKGKSVLSRENWKFLMHRIGIVTDYFETVVSRKELKDWRCREDICLSVCEDCKKAKKLLEEYRNSHIKMSNIERQFCLKIEWLLSRNEKSDEELYKLSKDAVCCTVQEDWKENLSVLYVGPEELEAMLLVVWSLLKKNELMDAFRLFDQIQRYPKIHNWEPRMREMICAQIALIGIKLYERMQKIDIGYKIGMESLELLRQQSSQRYAYPLLVELVRIGIMLEKEKSEELLQFQKFQKAFEIVYEENKIPYIRVWQCGSIENSYDVGMVLKRMRMAQEKTQEEVCIDEKGFSFLNVRQLSRIEKGENRPSTENFQFLTRKMGRELDWIMPMLETDSIEVLSMRQDIIYAIGMRQWKNAQNILEQLKTKIGAEDYKEPQIQQEIRFIKDRYDVACVLGDLLEAGELPLRVTHNDTKLNNVMIDNVTGKGLCVIDLDTVMPGLSVNDFGDSIRFGASTAAEDEIDLTKVSCDMNLYEIYLRGFLKGCNGKLTSKEMELLPFGAKVMTFECGMRFLTDYLEGDHYFKIHRENHNLDRCRTQFKLVEDMENKWEIMQKITEKYRRMYKQEKSDYFGY